MKLADISIRRPIFATMMIAALVVLGLFSFGRLGVDLFPNIDFPIVTITTTLKGASPEEVETSLTKPIEEAVNTISGIDELRSTSFEGLSQVIVTFVLEKNADVGAQEVRDAVSRVIGDLPQGTDPPVIQKFDPGASPVLSIAVNANRPLRDITELARKLIKEPLETLKGVGRITMVGGREREIHVVVDAAKLTALGLSIHQVKDALKQQNIEVPGGRVDQDSRDLILRTMGRIEDPAGFGDIVVTNRGGVPLRIRDVARVIDTEEEPRTLARLDGSPTVSLIVQKQSGANTVEVIRSVKEALAERRSSLPPGMSAQVVRDQSGFILSSVRTVEEHLVLGALLACVVVLLFMGDWRSTLIASLAIPTSLIATFLLMDAAGFTLNNMTLLALALAVGVVIDDAIVVLENIFRHMEEEGKPARQAAFEATDEIGMAVMATTVSLIIIFLPLAYMPGIVGRFLKSYGLTVAFAIGVSLFVAFSLTPMLCSRYLKVTAGPRNRLQIFVDGLNDRLKEVYGGLILWSLRRRWVLVATAVGLILSTGVIIRHVGKDFIPPDDASEFNVTLKAPEGTSLAMTSKILEQLEAELRRLPGVKSLLTSVGEGQGAGVNDGLIYVRLLDLSERKKSQFAIMAQARQAFAKYKGLRIGVAVISPISGGGFKDADFNYFLTGPDLKKLQEAATVMQSRLKTVSGLVDVDSSLVFAKPELKVHLNRERAQDLGVKVEDIANTLRTMVGGEEDITKYKEGDDLYQVRLRVAKDDRNRAETIAGLTLPSTRGLVRLDNVATLVEERGPAQIERINRQRQVSFTANLQGLPIGDAIKKAEEITKSLHLPPEYKSGLLGKAKEFGRMIRGFLIAFGLAFIFMYMVLGAQFESFLHPVTILLSLPLSIPFALISLLIVGQNLTIFSIMGVFMLFGIVKKNAILQVDYTNTLRARGMERNQAILEANKTRLRPILMTTLVLVAAMLPVAFGKGPGAANRATMAVVIVGGQSLCLLITLLITPVAYSLFDDALVWMKAKSSPSKL
jgi:HAE1 family hydrophobic/amphiphilic exporter-1